MSDHPHLPVEQVATSEVHQGKRILLYWVVFDVDSVVLSFEVADSHVGRAVPSVEWPWMG